jgi:hypothetical protein
VWGILKLSLRPKKEPIGLLYYQRNHTQTIPLFHLPSTPGQWLEVQRNEVRFSKTRACPRWPVPRPATFSSRQFHFCLYYSLGCYLYILACLPRRDVICLPRHVLACLLRRDRRDRRDVISLVVSLLRHVLACLPHCLPSAASSLSFV